MVAGWEPTAAPASTPRSCAACWPTQFPQWQRPPRRPGRGRRVGQPHLPPRVRALRAPAHGRRLRAGVAKEHRWLPVLAPRLPLPVPEPVALGAASPTFPSPVVGTPLDRRRARRATASTRSGSRSTSPGSWSRCEPWTRRDGPPPGEHSFLRAARWRRTTTRPGRCLAHVSASTTDGVWEAALASTWDRPDVWFHGDVAVGNLLVRDGRLAAVIDFGTCGVGDPACDLVIAWTFLGRPGPAASSGARSISTRTPGRGHAAGRCGRRCSGLGGDPGSPRWTVGPWSGSLGRASRTVRQ